jgi:D-alanyl-D-alanine carboxypeptidase (penicillin-binding protein 5/6)
MIKKILTYILSFSIILSSGVQIVQAEEQPEILCETGVLIDSNTMTVIAEKDANKKMYPASLTKIMTTILAIENGKLSDIVKIDENTPYEIDGSHIALEPGEVLTLKDLLYATMLPSANDAALAVAKYIGGNEEDFIKMMNEKAKELGANNTNFANPHGLHDENHYTTAYDLALITKYAMENETFRNIVNTKKYEIKTTNKKSEPRYFTTLNKLLYNTNSSQIYVNGSYISPLYEGVTGVKTGYTPEAGNSLVATAQKDGTELIMVGLKGASLDMYQDAHNLFNYGFTNYKSSILIAKNTFVQNLTIKNGDSKEISAITEKDFTTLISKDEIKNIESKIVFNEIDLPLEKNEVVGKIEYSLEGKEIGSVNLITPTKVNSTNVSGGKLITIVKTMTVLVIILLLLVFSLKVYNSTKIKLNRKRRRKKYRVDI